MRLSLNVIHFDSIDDDEKNVYVSTSEGTVDVAIGMFKRYIHEGELDEAQTIVIVAICSTFMIHCINMYIDKIVTIGPNNFVRNVWEIIGESGDITDIQTLQNLRNKLINLGENE